MKKLVFPLIKKLDFSLNSALKNSHQFTIILKLKSHRPSVATIKTVRKCLKKRKA